MKHILVVGEKTSQVKKFVTTLCGTYQSTKQAKYTYTYEGVWNPGGQQVKFTFLPLAGHITTIDTAKGYGWGQCPPIKIVADPNAIVVKNTRKYVTMLRKQIKGKDELWLALDPDSEGDNIALEVVNILAKQLGGVPVKRIWNSSLTAKEIYRAFLNPKPWRELLALGVQGRRIIDAWLGFAGTREITRAARQVAKVKVLSVGRVQLPTLLLVVQADMAHEMFTVEDRWKLEATFVAPQGQYTGTHQLGLV
ncbi:MAG TPA: DNA topoisomerase, partial [Pseudodesulfovibrio sp.]|nr:DNA topoisomerase [Pseudodesulfovibrio sp.]